MIVAKVFYAFLPSFKESQQMIINFFVLVLELNYGSSLLINFKQAADFRVEKS
jgi:hypothetical protein